MLLPKLEYAPFIWTPSSAFFANDIEALQQKFLSFLFLKNDKFYPKFLASEEYENKLKTINANTLPFLIINYAPPPGYFSYNKMLMDFKLLCLSVRRDLPASSFFVSY